jgi:hypothetical protein
MYPIQDLFLEGFSYVLQIDMYFICTPMWTKFYSCKNVVLQRPNTLETPTTRNQSVQRAQAAQDPLQANCRCYNCGDKGHYANRCPNPRTSANQTAIAMPGPTSGANSILVTAKQIYAYGRVNHVAMEEAQKAPDVVIGMFLINNTSAIVLFDLGASHSFISTTYVEKQNLPMTLLRC